MNKIFDALRVLALRKYEIVRVAAGAFGLYFFFFYFELIDSFYLFRLKSTPGIINETLQHLGADTSLLILRGLLIALMICSALLAIGRATRLTALSIWVGYTFFYNFFICINQPHITYYIYILMSYVFISAEPFFSFRANPDSRHFSSGKLLNLLAFVYMYQMSISGFSKALSPEWREGGVLKILTEVRDPEPGILWASWLPDIALQVMTWFVLALECVSVLYIVVRKSRFTIWITHTLLYIAVILFIPFATHVGFVLLIFNIMILDPKTVPMLRSSRS